LADEQLVARHADRQAAERARELNRVRQGGLPLAAHVDEDHRQVRRSVRARQQFGDEEVAAVLEPLR
jgi:hypothetical protein